jgi:hypothetical protein
VVDFDAGSASVRILDQVVVIDERIDQELATRLASRGQVKVSDLAEASDGTLHAGTIHVLAAEELDDESEVEGWLERVMHDGSRTTFRVNGVRMSLASDARIILQPDALDALNPDLAWSGERNRADEDWQPPGQSFLHPSLSFGGRVTARVDGRRELDLDADIDDEVTQSVLDTRAYGQWNPSPWVEGYAEVRWFGREAFDDAGLDSSSVDTRVRSGPTYLLLRPSVAPWMALQIGRVDVEDDREWFYDQNLDGVRMLAASRWARAAVGVYRTDITPTSTSDDDKYLIANAGLMRIRELRPEVFVIRKQERRVPGNDRTWTGFRAPIKWKGLTTWSDWQIACGDYRDREVRSWAFDNGATFRWKAPFRGSVSFGYAFASGDSLRSDGIDREFRDTDLADNTDNFDGLKSFRYYGELTDPELSNLHVRTFGAGVYLTSWLSVDLLHHRYLQDQYRDRFRSDVAATPNELSKDLGRETDVIVGARGIIPVDVEVNWARFSPGKAFDTVERATEISVIVEWRR